MKVFGKDYSSAYDHLYKEKDYAKECDFLEAVFRRNRIKARRILDLGCGTGGHALILAERGYEVVGVDRSREMLALAGAKARKTGLSVNFIKGDITSLDLGGTFDAVISMFAVMGYQTDNRDLSAVCRVARRHLRDGGIFVFDCWNGNAVLTEKPGKRTRKISVGDNERIIRHTEPMLDLMGHTVETKFRLIRELRGRKVSETRESHLMRFFFPQELRHYLESAGFSQVSLCPFLELKRRLTENDWNMAVVAKVASEKTKKHSSPFEEIVHKGKIISIILRDGYRSDKIVFFGKPEFSQQLGFLPHSKGSVIKSHFHKEAHRKITLTQEVLFMRKGRAIVNFYTTGKEYICSKELDKGDIIFLCSGGHGFEMLENTEMIEVKQGPYSGRDSDKEIFEGIENDTRK